MAEWAYGRNGRATIIVDNDCFRNSRGQVIAWINGINLYSLRGQHIGWYEKGIIYDNNNSVIGFIRNRTGHLPSTPGIGGTPGTPGFSGKPGKPGLSGVPGRPGHGGWSMNNDLDSYFEE